MCGGDSFSADAAKELVRRAEARLQNFAPVLNVTWIREELAGEVQGNAVRCCGEVVFRSKPETGPATTDDIGTATMNHAIIRVRYSEGNQVPR